MDAVYLCTKKKNCVVDILDFGGHSDAIKKDVCMICI